MFLWKQTPFLSLTKTSWLDPEKKSKIENIAMMLEAALQADSKVGLKTQFREDVKWIIF